MPPKWRPVPATNLLTGIVAYSVHAVPAISVVTASVKPNPAPHLHQCLPVLWQQQLLWGDAQGLIQPAGEGSVVRSKDGPLGGVGQVGGNARGLQM
jgi:hypothetical protein